MTVAPEPPLHDAADDALAVVASRYRVSVREDPDRLRVLAPADGDPPPTAVRVVRLVPEGTNGESLTVVLATSGGVAVYVRRTLEQAFADDAPALERLLLDLPHRLGWARRR